MKMNKIGIFYFKNYLTFYFGQCELIYLYNLEGPGKPGQSSSLIVSQSPVQSPMPSMSMAEEHNNKLH